MESLQSLGNVIRHWLFGRSAARLFLKGLRSEIKTQLSTNPSPIIKDIKALAEEIQESDKKFVKDSPSRGHLEFSSHVLAAYKVLMPIVGIESATVQLLERAMMKGIDTQSMRFTIRTVLQRSRNMPDRLYNIFGWLMKQYGTTFEWTAPHSHSKEKREFSIEIQRCFYFDFFSAHDAPFLTPILCQVDSIWFNMIDPNKHGFSFDKSRYKTQGYGASTCTFPIIEVIQTKSKKN